LLNDNDSDNNSNNNNNVSIFERSFAVFFLLGNIYVFGQFAGIGLYQRRKLDLYRESSGQKTAT